MFILHQIRDPNTKPRPEYLHPPSNRRPEPLLLNDRPNSPEPPLHNPTLPPRLGPRPLHPPQPQIPRRLRHACGVVGRGSDHRRHAGIRANSPNCGAGSRGRRRRGHHREEHLQRLRANWASGEIGRDGRQRSDCDGSYDESLLRNHCQGGFRERVSSFLLRRRHRHLGYGFARRHNQEFGLWVCLLGGL
ncbi:unnamed protein product [Linum tenue]|uniref:Uncharacterized protein n=1 Tax=Linum tenue TaxID=586396 RepID=A0AAV0K2V5_9ROSI|nr:unnamed protein product [Linum tenue]CAI0416326.1 unnamed protein product [Linum tenue]